MINIIKKAGMWHDTAIASFYLTHLQRIALIDNTANLIFLTNANSLSVHSTANESGTYDTTVTGNDAIAFLETVNSDYKAFGWQYGQFNLKQA